MKKDDIGIQYKKNIIFSLIVKGFSVLLGLVIVNIYLQYLGNTNYGLWITISSIASWVAMGDLGIGNGLRNELAKAYADNNVKKQQVLISTAIIVLLKVSVIILFILSVISEILIITGVLEIGVRASLYITNLFMCINFVLGIFVSISHAYQLSYYSSFSQLLYSGLSIIMVLILVLGGIKSNLTIFAVINGSCNTLAHIFLIKSVLKKIKLKIDLKTTNKLYVKSIIGVGIQFFVLQLCGLILYSTDNVIIKALFGSEEVTKYAIITKIFSTGEMIFSIFLVSLWSGVTYQYSLKNYTWIMDKIKQLLKVWTLFVLGTVVISFLFNILIKIWLGEQVEEYSWRIIALFAFYSSVSTFGSIFVNIANGMGVIKLQLIMVVIETLFNIPLSIYLSHTVGMGIMGVKLATLICIAGSYIIMPNYIWLHLKRRNLQIQ